jgi:hypothetical protein
MGRNDGLAANVLALAKAHPEIRTLVAQARIVGSAARSIVKIAQRDHGVNLCGARCSTRATFITA